MLLFWILPWYLPSNIICLFFIVSMTIWQIQGSWGLYVKSHLGEIALGRQGSINFFLNEVVSEWLQSLLLLLLKGLRQVTCLYEFQCFPLMATGWGERFSLRHIQDHSSSNLLLNVSTVEIFAPSLVFGFWFFLWHWGWNLEPHTCLGRHFYFWSYSTSSSLPYCQKTAPWSPLSTNILIISHPHEKVQS
jgi:hypothetical protein